MALNGTSEIYTTEGACTSRTEIVFVEIHETPFVRNRKLVEKIISQRNSREEMSSHKTGNILTCSLDFVNNVKSI